MIKKLSLELQARHKKLIAGTLGRRYVQKYIKRIGMYFWVQELKRHFDADAKFVRQSIKKIVQHYEQCDEGCGEHCGEQCGESCGKNSEKKCENFTVAIFKLNSMNTSRSKIEVFFKHVYPKEPGEQNKKQMDIPFEILGESQHRNFTLFLLKFLAPYVPTATTSGDKHSKLTPISYLAFCNACHTTGHSRKKCKYRWIHLKCQPKKTTLSPVGSEDLPSSRASSKRKVDNPSTISHDYSTLSDENEPANKKLKTPKPGSADKKEGSWISFELRNPELDKESENHEDIIESIRADDSFFSIFSFNIQGDYNSELFRKWYEENPIIAVQEGNSTFSAKVEGNKPENFEIISTNTDSRALLLINVNVFDIIKKNPISDRLSTNRYSVIANSKNKSVKPGEIVEDKSEGAYNQSRCCDALIKMKKNNKIFLVMSIYAPDTNAKHQKSLFEDIQKCYQDFCHERDEDGEPHPQILLAGDFNGVELLEIDVKHKRKREEHESVSKSLECLTDDMKVYDVLPIFTDERHPTNRSGSNDRRIDRIYTSLPQNTLISFHQHREEGYKTTHSSLQLDICLRTETFCKLKVGYPRLLVRDGIVSNENFMRYIKNNNSNTTLGLLIKDCQTSCKRFTEIIEGIHVGVDEVFFDTEVVFRNSRKKKYNTIRYLESVDGKREGETTESMISIAHVDFTQKLNSYEDVANETIREFLLPFNKKLDNESLENLGKEFTVEELKSALETTSNQASPGMDGIGFRLLKKLWNKAGVLLTEEANKILKTGELPDTMKEVAVVLVNRGDDPKTVDDYRPIFVANCCLRVIAVAIKRRLHKNMKSFFSDHHFGFVPNRGNHKAIQSFGFIKSEVDNVPENTRLDEAMLLTDFTKAFESVHPLYIKHVFEKLKFPDSLKNFFYSLTQTNSHVIINNYKSKKVSRSNCLLQGLPCTGILFAILMEPVLSYINYRLEGIQLIKSSTVVHSLLYADDLLVFLGGRNDTVTVLSVLEEIRIATGLGINTSKSKLLVRNKESVSSGENNTITTVVPMQTLVEKFSHLGIHYNQKDDKELMNRIEPELKRVRAMHGYLGYKVWLINSRIFPIIYYHFSASSLKVNGFTIKKIMNLVDPIFYNVGRDKLITDTMCGGFGLVDLNKSGTKQKAMVIYNVVVNSEDWICIQWRRIIQKLLYESCLSYRVGYNWKDFLLLEIDKFDQSRIEDIRKGFLNAYQEEHLQCWFQIRKTLPLPLAERKILDPNLKEIHEVEVTEEEKKSIDEAFANFSVYETEPKISERVNELLEIALKPYLSIRPSSEENIEDVVKENTGLNVEEHTEEVLRSRWTRLFQKIGAAKQLHGRNVEFFQRVAIGQYFCYGDGYSKCFVCHEKVNNSKNIGYFVHKYFNCSISNDIFKLCDISGVELKIEAFFNPELTIEQMVSLNYYLSKVNRLHILRRSELESVDTEWVEKWFKKTRPRVGTKSKKKSKKKIKNKK
ncbi:Polyprotein of L1-like non-LTR retrotransposon Zorro 1, partial [Candida maltosa Xu316]